jgi:H+-translocating NAD(P) transhydrogenase subunit alpha
MGEAITWLTIFVLAAFVGVEVISKVSSTLHTPLMSGANAIHGVILVGAIAVAGTAESTPVLVLSLIAVVLAAINMAGGFVVTDRMLLMFTRRPRPLRAEERGALRARPSGSVESSPPSSGRFDGPAAIEPRSEQ